MTAMIELRLLLMTGLARTPDCLRGGKGWGFRDGEDRGGVGWGGVGWGVQL